MCVCSHTLFFKIYFIYYIKNYMVGGVGEQNAQEVFHAVRCEVISQDGACLLQLHTANLCTAFA